MTSSDDAYYNMKERISCMMHTMDQREEISKQIQLPRKSNSRGYGGRHCTRTAKSLLENATDANDWGDLFLVQKFP